MAQSMSFYAHRVNSFKLLAHVNRLMGVVHTTCRTTMLIAMYFGEYPIYITAFRAMADGARICGCSASLVRDVTRNL